MSQNRMFLNLTLIVAAMFLFIINCYAQSSENEVLRSGQKEAMNGKIDDAIIAFNKAIELNPKDSVAYFNRAYAYGQKGNYDQAISDVTKAIEMNPKAIVYDYRGELYGKKGNYDQEISDCSKAIELNPNFAQAYHERGLAYSQKNNIDQAIGDFNKAIELNPKYADAYYERAITFLYFKKDYNAAWADVHKAEELGQSIDAGFLAKLKQASGRDQ